MTAEPFPKHSQSDCESWQTIASDGKVLSVMVLHCLSFWQKHCPLASSATTSCQTHVRLIDPNLKKQHIFQAIHRIRILTPLKRCSTASWRSTRSLHDIFVFFICIYDWAAHHCFIRALKETHLVRFTTVMALLKEVSNALDAINPKLFTPTRNMRTRQSWTSSRCCLTTSGFSFELRTQPVHAVETQLPAPVCRPASMHSGSRQMVTQLHRSELVIRVIFPRLHETSSIPPSKNSRLTQNVLERERNDYDFCADVLWQGVLSSRPVWGWIRLSHSF